MHAFTIIAMLAACCGNGSAAFQPSPKIDQRCPWGAESQRRHDRIFHRNASPSEIEYSDEDPRRYGLHKLGNLLHELHPRVSASVLRLADIWVGKMIASESGDVGNDADSENERDWNNVVRALEAVQKELKAIKEANPEWKEYCEAEPGAVAMLAAIIEEVDNMISVEGCMSIGPQASLPYLDAMRDVLVLRTELAGDKDQDEDAKEAISLFIDLRDQAAAYLLDFIDWIES
uniref:Uncharacterized protein n=1 Tax=Craspedostauros australis TaxID=1486917 RepID=A0A7R9WPN5_9STRA